MSPNVNNITSKQIIIAILKSTLLLDKQTLLYYTLQYRIFFINDLKMKYKTSNLLQLSIITLLLVCIHTENLKACPAPGSIYQKSCDLPDIKALLQAPGQTHPPKRAFSATRAPSRAL